MHASLSSDACVILFSLSSDHPSLSSDACVAVVLSVTPYRYSLPRGDTVLSVTSVRYLVSYSLDASLWCSPLLASWVKKNKNAQHQQKRQKE